jgi:hypothetical protein
MAHGGPQDLIGKAVAQVGEIKALEQPVGKAQKQEK